MKRSWTPGPQNDWDYRNKSSSPFLLDEVVIGGVTLSNVKADAIRRKADHLQDQGDNWATIGNLLLTRFEQVGIDGPGRNCVFVS